jgi:hypothetical protein
MSPCTSYPTPAEIEFYRRRAAEARSDAFAALFRRLIGKIARRHDAPPAARPLRTA